MLKFSTKYFIYGASNPMCYKSFWSLSQIKSLLTKFKIVNDANKSLDTPTTTPISDININTITKATSPTENITTVSDNSDTEFYFPHQYDVKADGSDIHPDIREIFRKTKPRLVDGLWKSGEVSHLQLARYKAEYISKGYEWPRKKLRDISQTFLKRYSLEFLHYS